MCLIITILIFIFSVYSFLHGHWGMGSFQMLITFIFFSLWLRNISEDKDIEEHCIYSRCSVENLFNIFLKKR